jgi:hypothetical protein
MPLVLEVGLGLEGPGPRLHGVIMHAHHPHPEPKGLGQQGQGVHGPHGAFRGVVAQNSPLQLHVVHRGQKHRGGRGPQDPVHGAPQAGEAPAVGRPAPPQDHQIRHAGVAQDHLVGQARFQKGLHLEARLFAALPDALQDGLPLEGEGLFQLLPVDGQGMVRAPQVQKLRHPDEAHVPHEEGQELGGKLVAKPLRQHLRPPGLGRAVRGQKDPHAPILRASPTERARNQAGRIRLPRARSTGMTP